MLADRYMKLASTPISADNFYGIDVRYSDDFETLENELAKASSLHAGHTPDWALVRAGCEALLRSQSKDLRAAVWLAWSLHQQESVPGLTAGLAAINLLCNKHWKALHPRKPRTRLAALIWLTSRVDQAVDLLATAHTEPDDLKALTEELLRLEHCMSDHFADQAPVLMPVCRRLDALARRSQSQASPGFHLPESGPTPAPGARIAPLHHSRNEPPTAVCDSRDAHKCLRAIQDQARLLCNWWLQESVTDPRAIRLARTLMWLPIDNLPEHDANKSTTLRGLPADRLASYRERLTKGQHRALLVDLETSLARSPFWLDGQHMAWQCLLALEAQPAMHEVEVQLALLLKRLPGLHLLCFHDQSAFADEQTRAWIESRVKSHNHLHSAPQPSTEAPLPSDKHPWDDALQKATQQLRNGSLRTGIRLIKQAIPVGCSERERFHWQLAQARLCYHASQYEMAYYQLESLYQALKDLHLDRWEPDLALTILRLQIDCCCKPRATPALHQRKSEIYQRLCQLDLETALDQAPGPTQ